jgi:hypothetical protein
MPATKSPKPEVLVHAEAPHSHTRLSSSQYSGNHIGRGGYIDSNLHMKGVKLAFWRDKS